ncbi:MAG: cupin domain-containing protein [Chloroflexi bacterium]|nr:cupin domain-containing protein [Chloroflexota bacterium]
MAESKLLRFEDAERVDRGNGAVTFPMVGKQDGSQAFSAGITSFQPGVDVPLHSHNVEEMVIILEGEGECVLDGDTKPVKQWDTSYVPANVVHCFRNTGTAQMSIMWVYGSTNVTRTFADTGITVPHLSEEDKIANR